MNLEFALVELYLSGHICPLSMLRVKFETANQSAILMTCM